MEIVAGALSAFLGCAFPYIAKRWEDTRRHTVDLLHALEALNAKKEMLNARLEMMVVFRRIEAVEGVKLWLHNVDTINNEIKRRLETQLCSCLGLGTRVADRLRQNVVILCEEVDVLERGDLVRLLPEVQLLHKALCSSNLCFQYRNRFQRFVYHKQDIRLSSVLCLFFSCMFVTFSHTIYFLLFT